MSETDSVLAGLFADRYMVEGEIGRGATAIVYRARDQRSDRLVAVKLLRPELTDPIASQRFLKEIRVLDQLHHPGIVPLLDSGECDGHLFYILPLMDDGTLRARLKHEKQLPLSEAIAIARSIAVALGHAHRQGLVHRDVKPENILFSQGVAHLSDFGIARALERALGDSITSSSVVRGTPLYMSPEQAGGEQTIDARSDLYSLGCVFYEMLSGMPPFVGPSAQSVLVQRMTRAPSPLSTYGREIPSALVRVVTRALKATPADRFQSADEFVSALDAAAVTPESRPTLWQRIRSRRSLVATLGIVAGIASLVSYIRIREAPRAGGTREMQDGDPRRIAVLYLDDLTPTVVPQDVVDGITEDLIDRMGSVRVLRVISPAGVRPLRGRDIAPDSLARMLKVGTIVSGSVARSGNTLRVNVRVTDAHSSQLLFSQTLEAQSAELFALQDSLTEKVAFFLRQRLGDEIAMSEHRAATKSLEAWETVQRASAMLRRAITTASSQPGLAEVPLYLGADSLHARAEALDPNWAFPTIRRGRIALELSPTFRVPDFPPHTTDSVTYSGIPPDGRSLAWMRRAVELADQALRKQPGAPEALVLRGDARFAMLTAGATDRDALISMADRDFRAAIGARPNLAQAWASLAQLSIFRGQFADAAASAQRAFESDAFFEVRRVVSVALFASLQAGQFDDARRWCAFGRAHYAGDPTFTECELTLLGWTARSASAADTAWRLVSQIERADTLRMLVETRGYRRLLVAAVLARSGARDSARRVLRRVLAERASGTAAGSASLPECYVRLLLDERNDAVHCLADVLHEEPQILAQLASLPWFRPLHGDPRFDALLHSAQ